MLLDTRKVCDEENGDGKGWHYYIIEQDVATKQDVDTSLPCPTHPTSNTHSCVIEGEVLA